ncbi:MAG: PAS domain S-box protein [Bacteroidales bacterium]|nr:PAS domain S-box protein [Bacteroidales bacterium]
MKEKDEQMLDYLKKKIIQFEKTELKLKATNQQLISSEQQLRAANQQLSANEQQLRASEQQFFAFANNLHGVTFIKDTDLRYTFINKNFEDTFDVKLEEWKGKTNYEIGFYPKDVCEDLKNNDIKVINEKTATKIIEAVPIGDDMHYWMVIKFPLFDLEKNVTAVAGFAIDITEQREQEEKLKATNQQLISSEQQLRAANQQLSANEQQLRASNQQLISSEQQLKAANQQLEANNQQLVVSEERYRTFVDNASDAFYLSDMKGRFIDVNEAACITLGYTREELLKLSIPDVDINFPQEKLAEILEGLTYNESQSVESVHKTKNGKIFPVEVQIRTFGSKDKPLLLSLARDVTERKQAEENLKENEQFLNSVLESVQDGVSVLEPDLTIRHVNGAMNKWYEENLPLEGKKCYEVYQKIDKPCDPCPTLRCWESGKTEYNIMPGPHGSPVEWIELFSYPIKEANTDKITGVVEFVRNITERKQAEEKIKAKSLFLESLVQQSPFPTFVMDSKGFNVMVNEAFLKFWAVPGKEMVLGRNALTEPANVKQDVIKYFKEALRGKIVETPEIEFVSPYKNKKTITRNKMFPILDPTGTLTNVVVMQEDLTERKQAEEKEKEFHKNVALLSETAMQFVEFPQDKDIFNYIGEQLQEFVGKDSYIVVNSIDAAKDVLTTRAVVGMGKFSKKVASLFGKNPVGVTYNAKDEDLVYLSDGKLHLYKEGLYRISLKSIPKTVSNSIEKLLNIKSIFTIGFTKDNKLFGTIMIALRENVRELYNKETIETFIKQASIALQKQQAEEALKVSEEKYRVLFENAKDSIFITNESGKIVDVNNAACKSLGYTKEDLLKMRNKDIDAEATGYEAFKKIRNGLKEEVAFEVNQIRKDRTLIPVEITGNFYTVGDKKLSLAVVRDITERKQAEKTLRQSEEKYKTLVESMEDVIVSFSLEGTISYCSPNVRNFGGYDPEEEIGHHFAKYIADKQIKQGLQELFQEIIKTKKPAIFEFLYKPKSKEPFHAEATASPIINEETDEIVSIQCVVRDITERKQAEEELKNKMNELKTFYRATLGREERVIELKQEVNELLEQLGKNKKYRDYSK